MSAALLALAVALAMFDPRTATFLDVYAKRRPIETTTTRETAAAMAEQLRAFMYPKQRAYYTSPAKCKATSKTRRAGATAGGCRELLARSITTDGHRAMYVATTRREARDRAWINDTGSGFVDILRAEGEMVDHPTLECWRLGGVTVEVREADLVLNFSNGAQIALFGFDSMSDLRKERGKAKHVYWIDEAQDFAHLEKFYDSVIMGSLADFGGECWLSGTPGQDCAGFFYEVTKNEDDGDARLPGWDVHVIAVVDNPYFGRVTADHTGTWSVTDNLGTTTGPYATLEIAEAEAIKIRWDRTAGEVMRKKGWKGDEPDFIREWLGRWVKTDARYVYPVHSVPKHVLVYAPHRLMDNPLNSQHAPWYDHQASMRDLPRKDRGRPYEWMFSIGADFGWAHTPFALVMWAFTFDLPDVYEMCAWKQMKVLPDDQRAYIDLLWSSTDNIVALVGDPAGQKSADMEAWRSRFSLPIEDADKSAKNTWQELMAGDIRKGHIHYREGSPLLHEHRHLVYLPTKPGKTRKDDEYRRISDGTVPGNDLSDASLYSFKYLAHHLYRDKPKDTRAADERQADRYETLIDRAEEIREAMAASGEVDFDDGYTWEG